MSLLQSHSSKASILWCSVFFMVQHLYMNTRKKHSFDYTDFCGKMMSLLFNLLSRFAIAFLHGASLELALTLWTWKGKVMSLLFNTLSRFIIAFLLRSKHLLISWLQSPSVVILEPKKIKSVTSSTSSPSILFCYFSCSVIYAFSIWVKIFSWRRKWQPTPVFFPGKSHGQRSLVGCTVHGVTKSQTQLSD